MKTWTSTAAVVGLALAASVASPAEATLVQFKENFLAMSPQADSHSNRFAFNTYAVEPVPQSLLEKTPHFLAATSGDRIECSTVPRANKAGEAKVLVLLSNCLGEAATKIVDDWLASCRGGGLKLTGPSGQMQDVTFETLRLEDTCEKYPAPQPPTGEDGGDAYGNAYAGGIDQQQPGAALLSSDKREPKPASSRRLESFSKFGRVLETAPTTGETFAGMLAFVTSYESYTLATKRASDNKITHKFLFQFHLHTGTETNEPEKWDGCVSLESDEDLFYYNPFEIAHEFECGKLKDGIPVTYVSDAGKRECYCTCTVGSEMQDSEYTGIKQCVKTDPHACDCVWQTNGPFNFDNSKSPDKCVLSNIATEGCVSVPFPTDNYVGDSRKNNKDDPAYGALHEGPHVNLEVTRIGDAVYDYDDVAARYKSNNNKAMNPDDLCQDESDLLKELTAKVAAANPEVTKSEMTWLDYQKNGKKHIDDIKLQAYGKYNLSLTANDYSDKATCLGCVAFTDKVRPKATTECPTKDQYAPATDELTTQSLNEADDKVKAFYKYQKKATNDKCTKDNRCDYERFAMQDFFETTLNEIKNYETDGGKCFDKKTVLADFAAKTEAKTNPLATTDVYTGKEQALQTDEPVAAGRCARCCDYETHLKEKWIDYKCGYNYDLQRCSGDETAQCKYSQCLRLEAKSVANVEVFIKPEIKKESNKVIKTLPGEGYQTHTQVHRALQCTAHNKPVEGETCSYTASIGDLIKTKVHKNLLDHPDQYVFWRYKIEGDADGWHLWTGESDVTKHTFTEASTKITVEAWTQCGRAHKFCFDVHLHVHNDIKVCDEFDKMWYQTSVVASADKYSGELCAYPGSDFAELTFDFHAGAGLEYSRNKLMTKLSSVVCKLTFRDREAVQILKVKASEAREIVERFAVELQNKETTQPTTTFDIDCDFKYVLHDKSTKTQNCKHEFTIRDCNGPKIDVDVPGAKCQWDGCAGKNKAGPYEACAGNIVSATKEKAVFNTKGKACCKDCKNVPLTCETILDLPENAKDIKRCVPPPTGGDVYGAYTEDNTGGDVYGAPDAQDKEENAYEGYTAQTMAFMAKAVASHPAAAGATVVLAASAMVAVVALLVVRQRRVQAAADAMAAEGAYYPLLH